MNSLNYAPHNDQQCDIIRYVIHTSAILMHVIVFHSVNSSTILNTMHSLKFITIKVHPLNIASLYIIRVLEKTNISTRKNLKVSTWTMRLCACRFVTFFALPLPNEIQYANCYRTIAICLTSNQVIFHCEDCRLFLYSVFSTLCIESVKIHTRLL